MKKFKVEDLKCFNNVAMIIGKGKASCELFKVINSKESGGISSNQENIAKAFCWGITPQGYDFWADIHYRVKHNAKV